MNLGVTGISEGGTTLVGPVGCHHVTSLRVGGEVKDISVAASGEDHRVRSMRADLPADHVADNDALGVAVDDHQVEHLGT